MPEFRNALSEAGVFLRYTVALPRFLRTRISSEEAERRLRHSLANRESNFLNVVERGIYLNGTSPYRSLLKWAGVELGDIHSLVAKEGVEGALGALFDAGVHVSMDEMKGRRAIERTGLTIPVTRTAFDNPLLTRHYDAKSSGSRGARTRVNIDLALIEHEAAYVDRYLESFGLRDRPYAIWRPIPPSVASVKWLMRLEKLGKPLDKWFSHTRYQARDGEWKFAAFTLATLGAGRSMGRRFPSPEHVPGDSPARVTNWLAAMRPRGHAATLDTMVSSAVRVCVDARERGADISGTMFRVGGEPLTAAKVRIIEEVGCRVVCFYSTTETSFIGAPCAEPEAVDDVHLLTDKIAAIARPRPVGGATVDALIYTTLLPSSPKLMLNVESGDFARASARDCGCAMGRLGFTHHLREIRSYEKLTSEGVTFLGTELLRLIDEVLPARFGGSSADYQFVEAEEEGGMSRVSVVASPRLGVIDNRAMVEVIVSTLRGYPGGIGMTEVWTQGDTLRVVRREPYRTESAKILPLHMHSSGMIGGDTG